jgi:two-component system OmpR family sensor kinase
VRRHRFPWRRERETACDVPRRSRLQRRLFWSFGATIFATAAAVAIVVGALGPGTSRWRHDLARFEDLASAEFARAWPEPGARRKLLENVSRAFRARVTLTDANGAIIEQIGGTCLDGPYRLEVRGPSGLLGYAHGCPQRFQRGPWNLLLGLAVAGSVVWAASALVARRLTRPLAELERVTRAIGGGDLAARVRLGRHQTGEVGALADSVNEMAARIERQLREERALLAAVSHELRSPLARLRMLVELAQTGDAARLAQIEAEVIGIDALLGKLLASSRLEFGAVKLQDLPALDVARRALEAVGASAAVLDDATEGALVSVDPTLVGRALGNLLENAVRHGAGVERFSLRLDQAERGRLKLRFEVLDRGPGFAPEVLARAFEPFYSAGDGGGSGSLGLGLALVARIARAHGGRAFAENRTEGGARSVLELPATLPS